MFFLGAVKPLPQSSLEPGPSQASFHVLFNTVSWVRCPVSSQRGRASLTAGGQPVSCVDPGRATNCLETAVGVGSVPGHSRM